MSLQSGWCGLNLFLSRRWFFIVEIGFFFEAKITSSACSGYTLRTHFLSNWLVCFPLHFTLFGKAITVSGKGPQSKSNFVTGKIETHFHREHWQNSKKTDKWKIGQRQIGDE